MTTDLLHDHTAETFKGALHGATAVLCVTFGLYNLGAYLARREHGHADRRLLWQGLGYLGAGLFEGRQTYGHWRQP
jgi:hypothetical protein